MAFYSPPASPTKGPISIDHPAHTNSDPLSPTARTPSLPQEVEGARQYLGLHPTPPVDDEDELVGADLLWSRIRLIMREPLAEFFGTFILVLFGDGAIAQVLLSRHAFGEYQSIPWGYGIGFMFGVYVAGDSGAFLNPAVTLTFCIFRKLPWRRLPMYFLAQFLGALVAAGVVYANYIEAINEYEGHGIRTVPGINNGTTSTAQIFATYPQPFVSRSSQAMSEFVASALLVFGIFALKDDSNGTSRGSGDFFPLGLFFLMFGIAACFGWETGFALNPARDLGPRVMTAMLGYGKGVWTSGGHYFWVPLVMPFFGCIFGALLYDVFLYTGDTPVNTPWLGLKKLVRGGHARTKREKMLSQSTV